MESVAHSQQRVPLSQPWRALYRVWYYVVVVPFVGFITAFLGSLTYLFSFINMQLAASMGVLWARLILFMSMIRTRVLGRQHVDPKQSYVIVVNHESNLDILAIYGYLPVDFRWVMKIEIRKIPFLGGACARLKHVYVDRSNREKAIESLNKAREQLVDGTSILFFPEGTRSRTGEMLPFKKGAFRMAIELQLPVLPVTLRNTGRLMPARSMEARPGTLELMLHKPISVEDMTLDDLPALMERSRAVIEAGRSTTTPEQPISQTETS